MGKFSIFVFGFLGKTVYKKESDYYYYYYNYYYLVD